MPGSKCAFACGGILSIRLRERLKGKAHSTARTWNKKRGQQWTRPKDKIYENPKSSKKK